MSDHSQLPVDPSFLDYLDFLNHIDMIERNNDHSEQMLHSKSLEVLQHHRQHLIHKEMQPLHGPIASYNVPHVMYVAGEIIINGKVEKDGRPCARVLVVAWDKDSIGKDDYLGNTSTNSNGEFKLVFDKEASKDWIVDKKPDIYFVIRQGDTELGCSDIYKNVDTESGPFIIHL
jgi:hypothetical protein